MEVSPLAIYFVKNGSNGDKMLFKYPFAVDTDQNTFVKTNKRNPYSLGNNANLIFQKPLVSRDDFSTGKLSQFLDEDLSYLLAVNKKLCGNRFELKVNDIRFIGHPVNLEDYKENYPKESSRHRITGSSVLIFNIVFALKVTISHDVVNCYYDLSKRLGIALCSEEQRCQFVSQEAKIMLADLDEQSQQPEANRRKSVFQAILSKSLIAQHLKKVYQDLCNYGKVHLTVNNWIDISFCLPLKINYGFGGAKRITHKILMKSLEKIKPYHTMLLLVDRQELLKSMSADVSPALRRLLQVESPINPFYTLAADADLTLLHVLQLAGHLIYWGKATIIYPMCNTNVYTLSPHVSTARTSKLADKFEEDFPNCSYHATLSEYSLPISLRDKCTPMSLPQEQQLDNQKLLWLLKHGLLQQLHTYIYITPPSSSKMKDISLSNPCSSSVRGLLATVAETITEKSYEETNSSCSSLREEMEWQGDMKELAASYRIQNGSSDKLSFPKPTKDGHSQHQLLDDDQNSQDSTSNGYSGSRKNASSEDVSYPSFLLSQKNHAQQSLLSQSLTPSESEFGSVCSDDRSMSPGCGTSQVTEETVLQDLDKFLTLAEKDMVLSSESARNFEDLKLFSSLCRYFRGEHHMEEIMYRANIHRSQLLEILDKFRSVLITVQRVDPSISLGAET